METNNVLGLDVGSKRVGIARASTIAKIAQPLTSVQTDEIMKKLKELIEELDISAIAVGLPRNLNGDDTAQTSWVREWVQQAKKATDVPFYWQDEALTTKMSELHKQSAKKPLDDHAMAAAIILQDFLDTPDTAKVLC